MSAASEKMLELLEYLDDSERVQSAVNELYAENAVFKDPIQKVQGRKAIKKMWRSLGTVFKNVRVEILDQVEQDDKVVVHWIMVFDYKVWPAVVTVPGVSWLETDDEGRFKTHTDYWDLWDFMKQSIPGVSSVKKLMGRRLQKA
ncbi:MAG: nuclear transport factor 2 family protein [Pseudomonadales bacterium]|nr:nuclear transport factor 2 family protein [Pseudomonadales bacterium]